MQWDGVHSSGYLALMCSDNFVRFGPRAASCPPPIRAADSAAVLAVQSAYSASRVPLARSSRANAEALWSATGSICTTGQAVTQNQLVRRGAEPVAGGACPMIGHRNLLMHGSELFRRQKLAMGYV